MTPEFRSVFWQRIAGEICEWRQYRCSARPWSEMSAPDVGELTLLIGHLVVQLGTRELLQDGGYAVSSISPQH